MSEVKYIVEYRDKDAPGGWWPSASCGDSSTPGDAEQKWKDRGSRRRYRIVEIRTVRTVVKESE